MKKRIIAKADDLPRTAMQPTQDGNAISSVVRGRGRDYVHLNATTHSRT